MATMEYAKLKKLVQLSLSEWREMIFTAIIISDYLCS